MIFLGDIAIPDSKCESDFTSAIMGFKEIFNDKMVVANLEGALVSEAGENRKRRVLFNHIDSIKVLKQLNIVGVSLANNHIADIKGRFKITLDCLTNNNIVAFGADYTKPNAQIAKEIYIDGKQCLFIGTCWGPLLNIQDTNIQINVLEPRRLIEDVKRIRRQFPESCIIVMPHWNFDLELYPFPLYRQLSKALIDSGANAIIGSHSHCVQGIELYKGSPIAYCLGNFILPHYEYFDRALKYPEFTKEELALEWNPATNEIELHWFEYFIDKGRHGLKYIQSEKFNKSNKIKKLTPYAQFDDIQYVKWFAANRCKNWILPIYKDYNKVITNHLIDLFIKARFNVARFLAQSGLRSGIE